MITEWSSILVNQLDFAVSVRKLIFDEQKNPISFFLINVNPKFEKEFSIKASDVLDLPFTELPNEFPFNEPDLSKVLFECAIKGKGKTFEFKNKAKDKYYKIQAILLDEFHIVSIYTDITKQKKLEIGIKAESSFSNEVISAFPGLFYMAMNQGQLVMWNSNMKIYTEATEEQMASLNVFTLCDQVSKDEVIEKFKEAKKNGASFIEYNFISIKQTVTPFYFSIRSIHLHGMDYLIGSGFDISDRRKMEEALKANNDQINFQNTQIIESIYYSKTIIDSLLPKKLIKEQENLDSFIIWRPKDIVGGDIYFFKRFEEKFLLGILDCTGHGVPGALLATTAYSALERIVDNICNDDPGLILKHLNQILITNLYRGVTSEEYYHGLDAVLCHYDNETKNLLFAGAKLGLFYCDGKDVEYKKGSSQSIGYFKSDLNFDYKTEQIKLNSNSSFYITSDGFESQIGGTKNFPFGKSQIKKLILDNHHHSMDRQVMEFISKFEEYKVNEPQLDDISLIGFKIK